VVVVMEAASPPLDAATLIGLLFGMGLLLGLAVAPVIAHYAGADPSALWQAAGATAAFVAAAGAYGYATRRDLSSWGRTLFWALLGLIAFGIVGAFTIYDFNRLRRGSDSAVFLLFLKPVRRG
jgi:FtsH-binding integral membrane protein